MCELTAGELISRLVALGEPGLTVEGVRDVKKEGDKVILDCDKPLEVKAVLLPPHNTYSATEAQVGVKFSGTVVLYTDGACRGNPGNGGFGGVIFNKGSDERSEYSGGFRETTNQRMELRAVVEGLKLILPRSEVELYSDSRYVCDGISQWLPKWRRNGFKTAAKKTVKNQDLWLELDALLSQLSVKAHWVKGHADDPLNIRCDRLARIAASGQGLKIDYGARGN